MIQTQIHPALALPLTITLLHPLMISTPPSPLPLSHRTSPSLLHRISLPPSNAPSASAPRNSKSPQTGPNTSTRTCNPSPAPSLRALSRRASNAKRTGCATRTSGTAIWSGGSATNLTVVTPATAKTISSSTWCGSTRWWNRNGRHLQHQVETARPNNCGESSMLAIRKPLSPHSRSSVGSVAPAVGASRS